jgi:hypothetical protein
MFVDEANRAFEITTLAFRADPRAAADDVGREAKV